jgi:hypothetical protein
MLLQDLRAQRRADHYPAIIPWLIEDEAAHGGYPCSAERLAISFSKRAGAKYVTKMFVSRRKRSRVPRKSS